MKRLPRRSGGPPAAGSTNPRTKTGLPSGPPRQTPVPGMTSVIRTRISRGPSVAGGSFHIATKGAVTAPSGCASRTLPSGCGRRASLPLPSQDRSAGRHSAVGSFGGGKGGGSTARTNSMP